MRKKTYFSIIVAAILFLSNTSKVVAGQNTWKSYVSLYNTYINFSNSKLKDNGWAFTGYGSMSDRYNLLECGVSQTYINYKQQSDLDQTDFTLAYTNIDDILKNHSFRIGFHYIISDDSLTDKGKIFFGKVTYFRIDNWNTGIELDYSLYNNESPNLKIVQVLPHVGIYFNKWVPKGSLYAESKFYYIHKNNDLDEVTKDNFFSFEQSLTWNLYPYYIKFSGWCGEQIFAVKNNGFVVYNLSDKYKGGAQLEIGYTFENNLHIYFNIDNEWLKHTAISGDVKQTIFSFSISKEF